MGKPTRGNARVFPPEYIGRVTVSARIEDGKRGDPRKAGEMNVFRLAGDMTHLISVLVLLLKIHTIKSCAAWMSGFVQTLLYADFFYYYINSWKNNVKLTLPA
jgi:hypothetical protein